LSEGERSLAPVAGGPEPRRQIRRLMLFFAAVYLVEGFGQTGGLIAQLLTYYLKEVYGWTPVKVTASLAVLTFPWVIKPVYGIVSDFVPLFGYRRKSYLILANAVAAGGLSLDRAHRRPGRADPGAIGDRLCDGGRQHLGGRRAGRERPAARP
jgi:hypothetical protein